MKKQENPYIGKIGNGGAQVVRVKPANDEGKNKVKDVEKLVRRRRKKGE